ncbi:MAG TPA: ABC transporter ATP-binding protein [Steroidobacteraceae bacterium]|jgi:simple sugar transport system ATP-binding protein|nr:ABC transporter ATP-binding protein [Steroidobacteraceae bacterium]
MLVALKGIHKRFGSVHANRDVHLQIGAGEVLALLGENGAGKSTLMKILYGFYAPDAGEILIDGVPVRMDSPRTAMSRGIGMVFQHFSLVRELSVRENLLLAYPHSPWWQGRAHARANRVLRRLREFAPDIDPDALVSQLSVGEQQQVELVKVLNVDARLVILDEPTSVLTPPEAERLWALVRKLAEAGHSVVFITHKLEDVMACADRVAIMRAGALVDVRDANRLNEQQLVELMMGAGAHSAAIEVDAPASAVARLLVAAVSATRDVMHIEDINLELAAGEILGIAGVAGNGQALLADAVAGFAPLTAGEVILAGNVLHSAERSIAHDPRIGYIPENPLRNAVAADLSNYINLLLRRYSEVAFFPRWEREKTAARALIKRFDVRPPLAELSSGALSGGNLQKLVIARELSRPRELVVACYPTMGLDVHAAAAVYQHLFAQARAGACVLWISEDLDDLMRYAHRIAVLYHGRIVVTVDHRDADRHVLGRWMTGAAAAAA